jgi:hypothetical protein
MGAARWTRGRSVIEVEDVQTGAGGHVVQFYEADSDLVGLVASYLIEGLREGDSAVVVATEAHRRGFEQALREGGIDPAALGTGRLRWLDAAATLARFCAGGTVDRQGFHRVIGGLVRRHRTRGTVERVAA